MCYCQLASHGHLHSLQTMLVYRLAYCHSGDRPRQSSRSETQALACKGRVQYLCSKASTLSAIRRSGISISILYSRCSLWRVAWPAETSGGALSGATYNLSCLPYSLTVAIFLDKRAGSRQKNQAYQKRATAGDCIAYASLVRQRKSHVNQLLSR